MPVATADARCPLEARPNQRTSLVASSLAWALALVIAACSSGGGLTGGSDLAVEPSDSMAASMEVGGQRLPEPKTYESINSTDNPHSWRVTVSQSWVQISPTDNGTIPPRSRVQITLSISPNEGRALPIGRHSASASFIDAMSGREFDSRAVSLEIRPQQQVQGWTDLRPSADTRTVYVSTTDGNDANSGLAESTPKRSIGAARSLLRQGFPDWLLLKRGDIWHEAFGAWTTGGRSAQEPQVIGSYGTSAARPLLRTGTGNGMYISGGATPHPSSTISRWSASTSTPTPTRAPVHRRESSSSMRGSNYLIEDCCFQGYHTNVVIMGAGSTGRFSNVRIRRNVIIDAYTTDNSHSQGMFLHAIDGLLIDENVFDHNGWNETVSGAGGTIFRHSIYVQFGSTGVVVQRNIISIAPSPRTAAAHRGRSR